MYLAFIKIVSTIYLAYLMLLNSSIFLKPKPHSFRMLKASTHMPVVGVGHDYTAQPRKEVSRPYARSNAMCLNLESQ